MLVEAAGVGIHVEADPRPNTFFLHGFAGSAADWTPTVQRLSMVSTARIDAIGHGTSQAPDATSAYTFDSTSRQLAAVHDALGGAPATWIGYSFGARLLLAFATKNPSRVARLVIESGHPGIADPAQRALRRLQDQADADLLMTRGLDAFLGAWHGRPTFRQRRGQPDWPEEVQRKRTTNRPEALARCLRGLGLSQQPDLRPQLARIQAPTLVLAGADDPTYVEAAKEIAARLPRGRLEIVDGAGHNLHAAAPEAYSRRVADFLARPIASLENPR